MPQLTNSERAAFARKEKRKLQTDKKIKPRGHKKYWGQKVSSKINTEVIECGEDTKK